jgi:catechol 2,3-dioxygenase-like lactoylglutathione lyase family enzyme
MSPHGWNGAAPIFRVRELRASLDYYQSTLGFKLDWHAGGIASVSRDHCCIFLCEGDQGRAGTWAWVGVDDAEALCDELRHRGAVIRHPPTNYEWALEMQVADLDGNVLRLGSEPIPDAPIGDWLDASGRLWRRDGGEWSEVESE